MKFTFTLYVFSLLILMFSCNNRNAQKVVFFGDSITAAGENDSLGYINVMRQKVDSSDYKLIGRGIGGNKVTDLENRMAKDVLALHPDIVFVYIGINDVWHFYEPAGAVGTKIERYEQGLHTLADSLQSHDIKIIFCTPTVIGENPAFEGEINQELDKYADVVRKVASETNSDLCDLRKDIKDYLKEHNTQAANSGVLTADRVHMNEKGNQFLAEHMLKYLN